MLAAVSRGAARGRGRAAPLPAPQACSWPRCKGRGRRFRWAAQLLPQGAMTSGGHTPDCPNEKAVSDPGLPGAAQVYAGDGALSPGNCHQSHASVMPFALEGGACLFVYQALLMPKIAFISDIRREPVKGCSARAADLPLVPLDARHLTHSLLSLKHQPGWERWLLRRAG